MTDEIKIEYLINLMKRYYSQGDDYFAYKSKKGNWSFGYSNDYPMQHGGGKTFNLPDDVLTLIINP